MSLYYFYNTEKDIGFGIYYASLTISEIHSLINKFETASISLRLANLADGSNNYNEDEDIYYWTASAFRNVTEKASRYGEDFLVIMDKRAFTLAMKLMKGLNELGI